MKTLKTTVLLVAGLALFAWLGGWLLPGRWEVSRSVVVAAPPAAVHARVADLRAWPTWSPFERQHPDMVVTHGGVTRGVDARRDWISPSFGDGWMVITAADPARGVWYDTGFTGAQPYKGVLQYESVPAGTRVTWTLAGDTGERALFRWTAPVMDRVFGPTLEQGLARLKVVAEDARPGEPLEPGEPSDA